MKQLPLIAGLILSTCLTSSFAAETAAKPAATPTPVASPQVQVVTSLGNFTIELNAERAPLTVANFLKYVDQGHYTNTIFHRVVAKFNIPCEADSAEYLRKLCLREGRTELRACYPSDICAILNSIGKYEGRPAFMSKSELERASALYFAKS